MTVTDTAPSRDSLLAELAAKGLLIGSQRQPEASGGANAIDAGYISVNGFSGMSPTAPFGGYKQSGFGREGGRAGLEEWLRPKNVFIALD